MRISDWSSDVCSSDLTYALEQRHNVEAGTLAEDIKEEIAKVQAADLVVFPFALFWFSIPAILNGWIDRVFMYGLFYDGKTFYSPPSMAERRVGKVGVKTVLSRWSPDLFKKKRFYRITRLSAMW